MSETKHTPGPWHVYKGHGLYVDSSTAGSVCKVAEKRASEQQIANAALIAAAPDMLNALKHVHTEFIGLAAYLETCSTEVIAENLPSLIASLQRKRELVEAAIAKAKGTTR